MPDYEHADALFWSYYHTDPAGLTLPRYWALLRMIGVLEQQKTGKVDHAARVRRLEALRSV